MSQLQPIQAYVDASGNIMVDTDSIGGDDEGGALFRRGPGRGGVRRARKIARLRRRLAALESADPVVLDDGDDDEGGQPPVLDLYQHAVSLGAVQENQFNGLGSVAITAGSTGNLTDTINRNIWGKGIVLDSDDPPSILVTAITVAGLPINIGSAGAPMSVFRHDSTRFGIQFGRRIALTGQAVRVSLSNIDTSGHTVSGVVVCDEMNPYMTQALWERMLTRAAVDMMKG